MKNSNRQLSALITASFILMSGCAHVNVNDDADDLPVNPDDFTTSINYDDLQHCSFNEEDFGTDYNGYSFRIMSQVLSHSGNDENVMISPASIMFAMDLAAAGANGNTLAQMTDLFSEGADPLEQQAFAASMMDRINSSQGVEFSCANAIWTNSSIMTTGLNPAYQDYVDEYFHAEADEEPFSMDTVVEINGWIDEHTNGMIDHVLDELEEDAAAVLVNAIAFEGSWAEAYEDYQVQPMTFTTSQGNDIDVDMLCGDSYYYYETAEATGFIQSYEGGDYALLVMLPTDESISANEFLADFTVEDYNEFLESRTSDYDVYTRLPEFSYDYTTGLNNVLEELGVVDAFSSTDADFTGVGIARDDRNLYIGQVLHKTHIELDRNGTRAAAVTVIVMDAASACLPEETETRYVYCDRPFAYAIVDTSTMNPIFLGTYNG